MPSDSFLEKTYQGSLDVSVFNSFRAPKDSGRIRLVFDDFQRIMAEFPSNSIEQGERIPEEMLKKMGEVGLFGISIPEAYGGLGFNLWEYLKVVELMSGQDISVALTSIAHLSIGIKGILLFGTDSRSKNTCCRQRLER